MTKRRKMHFKIFLFSLLGIAINLVFNHLASYCVIPIYFDTIGTIMVATLSGYVPGIFVALVTNLIESISYPDSAYYGIYNVLIAIFTIWFVKHKDYKKFVPSALYVLFIAFIGGFLGGITTWVISGPVTEGPTVGIINFLNTKIHLSLFLSNVLVAYLFDIIDKVISVFIAVFLITLVPARTKLFLQYTGWMQKPVFDEDLKSLTTKKWRSLSIKYKIFMVLTFACLFIATITTIISMKLFNEYNIGTYKNLAAGATTLASQVIDPDLVDEYIEKGDSWDEYRRVDEILADIKNSNPDIEYLYVYRIDTDGCTVVFDVDSEDVKGSEPGDKMQFEKSFIPYLEALANGESIDPIISNDTFGHLLTVYTPVFNDKHECVCYVGADITMTDIALYRQAYMMKLLSLGLGFLIFVLSLGIWLAKYHIIYPVNTMAHSASAFAYNDENSMDLNVKRLKEIQISTGDEVENLYNAVITTTEKSANYFHDIQAKARELSDFQNGLIIVLADMVENRDGSTGAHVRKTAAYVKIIAEELKAMGKYEDIIDDEYINNVFRSAPLHDIGKISIPDAILNKPGRLDDNEYEIMKTHTTVGANVVEKAMSTLPNSDYLEEAKNLVKYHHEKWNGTGYPTGLAGEDIPLSARIMAVADVFDALVSKRCYKDAFSFEDALNIIVKDAGTHFDPTVVEAFVSAQGKVMAIFEKYAYESIL